jgi:dUTPase
MKIIKKEKFGIHEVFNTNVDDVHNYVGNNIINHNCVVDYTYKGEIHLSLINTTDSKITITPGQKIIQFLEMPVYNSEVEISEETEEKFYEGLQDDRKDGGFGSTNNK